MTNGSVASEESSTTQTDMIDDTEQVARRSEVSNVGNGLVGDEALKLKADVLDAAMSGTSVRLEWDGDELGDGAFAFRINIREVLLPNAKKIGMAAFHNCKFIRTVNLPTAEEIGDFAFEATGCLTEVILGNEKKVASLGEDAFNLSLHFTGESNGYGNENGDKDGCIFVPDSLLEDYKSSAEWSKLASHIKPMSEFRS